jgi:SulP family sulfate permease
MFQITLPWPLAPFGIPVVGWLPKYKWKEWLLNDLTAGLAVFVFLIPQLMSYALLAGVPPVYSLYSAIIPLYVYACLGTSKQLCLGPMAITSLLLSVNVPLPGHDEQTIEYAVVVTKLSMVVGVVILLMGAFRVGTFVNLLSESVLVGFSTGAAIVSFISQLKNIFGIHVPRFKYTLETIWYFLTHLSETNVNACGVGVAAFAAVYSLRQWRKRNTPTPELLKDPVFRTLVIYAKLSNILSIVVGSAVACVLLANGLHIDVIGHVPSGLMPPAYVPMTFQEFMDFIPAATAISIVAFSNHWAVCRKFAEEKGHEVDATQEMISHGCAVVIGAMFHGFAGFGGITRSTVNADAGAHSQVSNIVAATLVLLTTLFLTPLLYYIPLSVLGAVVQVSVLSMIDFTSMLRAYRTRQRTDFTVMMATFLITLFIGVSPGLFAGIFISIGLIIYTSAYPQIVTLGQLPDSRGEGWHYKNVQRFPSAVQHPGVAILRMDGALFFANCAHFKETARKAAAGEFHTSREPIQKLIIDVSCWTDIDLACAQTLLDLKKSLDVMEVSLSLVNARAIVRNRLAECNFSLSNGYPYCYFSIRDALEGVDHAGPTYTEEQTPLRERSLTESSAGEGGEFDSVHSSLTDWSDVLQSQLRSAALALARTTGLPATHATDTAGSQSDSQSTSPFRVLRQNVGTENAPSPQGAVPGSPQAPTVRATNPSILARLFMPVPTDERGLTIDRGAETVVNPLQRNGDADV